MGASIPRDTLQNDYLVLAHVAWVPTLVMVGVLASTTSSALASIQSAARVLQALAFDDLIRPLRLFSGECNGEPVAAIVFAVLIGQGLLMVGSLDAIAPILTMFFLLTYTTTNVACFLHRVSGPSAPQPLNARSALPFHPPLASRA